MKYGYDELFIDGGPVRRPPPEAPPKGKKPRHERISGDFYLCPGAWLDRAAEVSGQYLILALRLYRRWRMRKPGTDSILASAVALAGPGPGGGSSRAGRLRLIARLEAAGLIEVVLRVSRRATMVRIIE